MYEDLKRQLVLTFFQTRKMEMLFPVWSTKAYQNVNLPEIMLLRDIAVSGYDYSIANIQKLLCISKPAVSQMLGVLEKKGYIVREVNKENRRKIIVTLTRKGQNLVKKAEPAVDNALTKIIERLGEAETKQLIASVERFAAILAESATG